ncbi:MAG: putative conserved small protein [Rhodobacteraceae bacterium HLUCCA08]|nr:MAG: putative conserved small protein [Rhodobacteraceae bacterium HLUCCA08]
MSHVIARPLSRHRPASRLSLARMLGVWHQRRCLARLDAAQLADIGITPAEAARESARPFWDLD